MLKTVRAVLQQIYLHMSVHIITEQRCKNMHEAID